MPRAPVFAEPSGVVSPRPGVPIGEASKHAKQQRATAEPEAPARVAAETSHPASGGIKETSAIRKIRANPQHMIVCLMRDATTGNYLITNVCYVPRDIYVVCIYIYTYTLRVSRMWACAVLPVESWFPNPRLQFPNLAVQFPNPFFQLPNPGFRIRIFQFPNPLV